MKHRYAKAERGMKSTDDLLDFGDLKERGTRQKVRIERGRSRSMRDSTHDSERVASEGCEAGREKGERENESAAKRSTRRRRSIEEKRRRTCSDGWRTRGKADGQICFDEGRNKK